MGSARVPGTVTVAVCDGCGRRADPADEAARIPESSEMWFHVKPPDLLRRIDWPPDGWWAHDVACLRRVAAKIGEVTP